MFTQADIVESLHGIPGLLELTRHSNANSLPTSLRFDLEKWAILDILKGTGWASFISFCLEK
jgi:hypothetical protein